MKSEDIALLSRAFDLAISDPGSTYPACEPSVAKVCARVAILTAFRSGVTDVGVLKTYGLAAVTTNQIGPPPPFVTQVYEELSRLLAGCETSLVEASDGAPSRPRPSPPESEKPLIGPAEIDEMVSEFAEAQAAAGQVDPGWPSFVSDEHLDRADRCLIGTYAQWVRSVMAETTSA